MVDMLKEVEEKQAKEIALLATEMKRPGRTTQESDEAKEKDELRQKLAQQKNLLDTEVAQRKKLEEMDDLRTAFQQIVSNDMARQLSVLQTKLLQNESSSGCPCTNSDRETCKELEEETEYQAREIEESLRNEIEKLGKALEEQTNVEKSPNGLERRVSEMEAENNLLKIEINRMLSSDRHCTNSDSEERCKELEEERENQIKVIASLGTEIEKLGKALEDQVKVEKSPNGLERKVAEMEAEKKLLKTEINSLLSLDSPGTSSEERCKELEDVKDKQTKEIERLSHEIEKLGKALEDQMKSPSCFERKVSEMEAENKLLKLEVLNLLNSDHCMSSDSENRCKEFEEEKDKYTAEINRLKSEIERLDKKPTTERLEEINRDEMKIKDLMEQIEEKGHESKKLKDHIGKCNVRLYVECLKKEW
jgi:chromosome segregation ATPase